MHHLNEVAGATGAATASCSAICTSFSRPGCGRCRLCREPALGRWDRGVDHILLAPDHHAVPAVESPHAATGADIHIMNLGSKLLPRLLIVEDELPPASMRMSPVWRYGNRSAIVWSVDGRRHHQPDCPRLLQFSDEIGERRGPDSLFFNQFLDQLPGPVEVTH